MSQRTPLSARKRPSQDEGASLEGAKGHDAGVVKRRCTVAQERASRPHLRLSIPEVKFPPTPPSSAVGIATLALKLVIPTKEITSEQQRTLKRRRADAERWKPKLQRPYPKCTEMNKAYPLKLLRHYPDANVRAESNFVKPKINRSSRLSHLLQRYPLKNTTEHAEVLADSMPDPTTSIGVAISMSARGEELKEPRSTHAELQHNIRITGSEHAQWLAWKSFSLPEQGRVDRGREAMVQSGLDTDDLAWEARGVQNRLPDWKRPWTGRFAG